MVLELADLMADGRWGDAQFFGGNRNTQMPRGSLESLQSCQWRQLSKHGDLPFDIRRYSSKFVEMGQEFVLHDERNVRYFGRRGAMGKRRILIIGGGASGTLAALHLLSSGSDVQVRIIEPRAELGHGLAYSTLDDGHVLNVRSTNMSAFPDDPGHFKRWLAARSADKRGGGDSEFVPRRLFGIYLCELLADLHNDTGRLEIVRGTCTALTVENDVVVARMADGSALEADQAILATGNEPLNSGLFKTDFLEPWSIGIERSIAPDDSLLILGSGLTMVHFVVSLLRRRHRGTITVLSRRGLIPQVHKTIAAKIYGLAELPSRFSPPSMLAWLRKEARLAVHSGSDWRAVMDGVRPYTQWIWQNMSLKARKQFLRHARPWWDTHRHRMAPGIADELQSVLASGQLRVVAGKMLSARRSAAGLQIEYWVRGRRQLEALTVAHAVQCTGICTDPFASNNPLIRQLIASGLGRADSLGLGLEVTRDCAVTNRSGEPSTRIFAIGPITRAAFWEITAVPDIRNQCALLANRLSLGAKAKRDRSRTEPGTVQVSGGTAHPGVP